VVFVVSQRNQKLLGAGNTGSRILQLAVIAVAVAGIWLLMEFQAFRQSPLDIPTSGVNLVVKPGASLKSVADRLRELKVLDQPLYLVLLGRYLDLDSRLKAGEYQLAKGITPEQLLQQLAEGRVIQHGITLIEGENFQQMMTRVRQDPVLEHRLQSDAVDDIMSAIGYSGVHPEGRFLPETYHFPRGTTDVELLRRAYKEMESFLGDAWPERDEDLPISTPYEALILASIVEKETAVPEERARIAGVFVRRLRTGMRLQTDPTVIYGMGERYDGDIRFRDLRQDTPYNTYTRSGLPPTPIAMPGTDAILAALHPADGDELYFVARGDGSHYFSRTLAEHNRAVDRFQRNR
jgi:UPF0755 protein